MASASADSFFVYIVNCCDGSLYIGHTSDVAARVQFHNEGAGAAWTRTRRPAELVYSEPAASAQAAVRREVQLKGWSHAKKLALIRDDIAALKSLAKRQIH
jgi:predicted GIY-YIG superfamily endonuclease